MPKITENHNKSEKSLATVINLPADTEQKKLIADLRKIVEEHKHLKVRTCDAFIRRFLSACDWDVDQALTKMESIYKIKADYPKWFAEKRITEYASLLKYNIKVMLDGRDKSGRRVYVVKMGNINPSLTNILEMAQLDDVWFESVLNEPDTQDNGISVIIDLAGYPWRMLKWLTPKNVKIAAIKAETLPIKLVDYHIVNSTNLLNAAVSLVFPFLNQNIKETIHFHYTNWPSLHYYVGADILPEEYGGKVGSVINYEKILSQIYEKENDLLVAINDTYITN